MNNLINRAIIPVINDRGISSLRMSHLIYIKEFIERISTKSYMKDEDLTRLEAQYGEIPDIITWGDYFQAEMATTMQFKNDDEFIRAFETVKFDMISSYMIFKDKGSDFFEWIENSFGNLIIDDTDNLSDEDKEIVHLKILMDYYQEIGITDRFAESELNWHSSFREALAI
ncbi:MAG TPA: hypothetical protein PKG60_01965 [Spirochaetota bacterium]|nr:hypothetical protein [Spirochaetota bacterium]HPS86501.1 hypothetical protein [Spirochaetota bacterium]